MGAHLVGPKQCLQVSARCSGVLCFVQQLVDLTSRVDRSHECHRDVDLVLEVFSVVRCAGSFMGD